MTPMIDVTFLLIIFFLVSSHLAKQENFLPLKLPVAGASTPDFSDRPTVTVQVLSDGKYHLGGQFAELDQVRRAIAMRTKSEGAAIRVRIRTDRDAPYEHIAPLLKICATAGSTVVFSVYGENVE
jgi:biopolymer transport protein ExbD